MFLPRHFTLTNMCHPNMFSNFLPNYRQIYRYKLQPLLSGLEKVKKASYRVLALVHRLHIFCIICKHPLDFYIVACFYKLESELKCWLHAISYHRRKGKTILTRYVPNARIDALVINVNSFTLSHSQLHTNTSTL